MNEQDDMQRPRSEKLRAIFMGGSVVMISAVIVGVGVYLWQQSAMRDLRKEASKTEHMLREEIDQLRAELAQTDWTYGAGEADQYLFRIHGWGPHMNSRDGEVNFYVAIPETVSLLDKLRLLAEKLSRFKFRGLPIEIVGIEERSGKAIATINLKETEHNRKLYAEWLRTRKEGKQQQELRFRGVSWQGTFFQGSAGGYSTTITLVKTFLQEDYRGEWIDGIDFYYEGEPIGSWDHISLSGTRYRENNED